MQEQLAAKKYFTLLKQDIVNELKAIESYLKYYSNNKIKGKNSKYINGECVANIDLQYGKSIEFLKENPQFSDKILYVYNSNIRNKNNNQNIERINKWKEEVFVKNNKNKENLIYKSVSGNMVRSKSEYIIDMNLYMKGIPFRYEAELVLGDAVFYPDFTILDPNTMRVFYWEHLGMIDNPEYYKKAFSKLQVC